MGHALKKTIARLRIGALDFKKLRREWKQNRRVPVRIEFKGVIVEFPPPYSPDFSPIEIMFSRIKSTVPKIAARTVTK